MDHYYRNEDNVTRCMGCMELFDKRYDICPHCGCEVGLPADALVQMDPGTILVDRYIVGRALGCGSFGVTYIGWDTKLERKVAIKEYLPSQFATREIHQKNLLVSGDRKNLEHFETGKRRFMEEGKKLAQVSGIDGIVHMYDCFEANNTAYIAMEYLRGETLAACLERRGKFTEQETMDLAIPLLQALQEVHEKGIIHRDIAPDNIFLARDAEDRLVVKLIDFGAAKFSATMHSKSLTVLIKPGYSPEEQYRSDGEQGTYTDVYAMAAVMYRMVTGVQPPDAFKRRLELESKKRDLLKNPGDLQKDLSDNFETALLNAMNVRIEDRTATAEEFLQELVSFEPVKRRGSTIKKIDFLRWPLWAKISVPLASLAAVGLLVFALLKVFQIGPRDYALPDGMTRVPDFVTASFEEAQQWASSAKVTLQNVGAEYVPNTPEGLVLRQDVFAGTIIYENEPVNVVVSTGEEHYMLPDVRGVPISYARQALECMDLQLVVQETEGPGLANGCVISQSIEPYSDVKSGDTIVLEVTGLQGCPGGSVPYLLGTPYDEALKQSADRGISVAVKKQIFSEDVDVPTVVEQSLAADTELEANQLMDITVAYPMRDFSMPNLLYKDKERATQLLKNIGIPAELKEETSEAVSIGLVFAQSVAKDTTVRPGDAVTLSVSKGGKPVELKDVVGMKEDEARKALSELGMAVKLEYDYDENVPEGCVISQSIPGGESATRGTSVVLVICSKEGLVTVADVSGKSETDARSQLEKQGLTVEVNEVYSSSAKGTVISQIPAGGSSQTPGTVVILTVSKGGAPATPTPTAQTSSPKPSTPTPTTSTNTTPPTPTTQLLPASNGWVETLPAGVDSTHYNITQKTQYSYSDKTTIKSEATSMPGYERVGSEKQYGNYGGWSDWTVNPVSGSETRDVQTATVYGYYYYQCPNCGAHMHVYTACYTWLGGCGNTTPFPNTWHQIWSTVSWDSAGLTDPHGTGRPYTDSLGGGRWYRWPEGPAQTGYHYRDRSVKTVYIYEGWSDYSDWTDTRYEQTSTRRVQTRTVYQYSPK